MKLNQFVIKVSPRCNLACTYCHWFRDPTVNKLPSRIEKKVISEFCKKLIRHIEKSKLRDVTVILHGGEPLLIGKDRMSTLAKQLRQVESQTGINLRIALTTNGVLVDSDWCSIFSEFNIEPCISIDGPKHIHDLKRIDLKGKGSHDRVVRGLKLLQNNGFKNIPALIVADPSSSPEELLEHLVSDLGISNFDVLIPNYNHDDKIEGKIPIIAEYYKKLFDVWLNKYDVQGVRVRCLESFIASVLGKEPTLSGVGPTSPLSTVVIEPNGSLEPHDVLRISGNSQVETGLNILDDEIFHILDHPVWSEAYKASIQLPKACVGCDYSDVCGGGYVIHRFSEENRYENRSIYCEDLKEIYAHVWQEVRSRLYIALEA